MYNYLVYQLWLSIPASAIAVLPFVVIVLLCCSVKFRSSTAGMVKFLLGDLVEMKEEEEEEEEDGTKYLIQGQPLQGVFLSMVTYCTFTITSCALMTFWYEFLVDVTYSCDPNLDCYPVPAPSFSFDNIKNAYLSLPPIVNCSDYETLPDNTTIVCFTFTFDYPQAFGAAGGVFAFAVFGIRAVIGILIWLKSNAWKRCLLFSLVTSYFVVSLGAILLGTLVPVFRPLMLGPTRALHLSVYILTFAVGFIVMPVFFLIYSTLLDNEDN